jgi:hypothetical protein
VAETLWQIFIDARPYFSAKGPALPQSQTVVSVARLHSELHTQGDHQLPIGLVAGTTAGVSCGIPTVQCWRISWKSRERRWINDVDTIGSIDRLKQGPLVCRRQAQKPKPVFEIVNIVKVFKDSHSDVDTISALMRSQKLTMAYIGIGVRGQCMDFMYFGKCVKEGCTYNHEPANVSPGKKKDVIRKIHKATAGYLATNTVA